MQMRLTPVTAFVGRHVLLGLTVLALVGGACAKRQPPIAPEAPAPPPRGATRPATPPPPPPPVPSPPPIVPPEPLSEGDLSMRSLDELNRDSPLRAAFFGYDSSEITGEARTALDANANLLQRYSSWVITIEGHCDERGTAEYNLSLGERRALAARNYLRQLGVPNSRLRTVSYGKEFPFDPGHDETAWAANRRAHFVITAK